MKNIDFTRVTPCGSCCDDGIENLAMLRAIWIEGDHIEIIE